MNTSNMGTGELDQRLLVELIERTKDSLSKPAQPMRPISETIEFQMYKEWLKNLPDDEREKVLREIVEDYL